MPTLTPTSPAPSAANTRLVGAVVTEERHRRWFERGAQLGEPDRLAHVADGDLVRPGAPRGPRPARRRRTRLAPRPAPAAAPSGVAPRTCRAIGHRLGLEPSRPGPRRRSPPNVVGELVEQAALVAGRAAAASDSAPCDPTRKPTPSRARSARATRRASGRRPPRRRRRAARDSAAARRGHRGPAAPAPGAARSARACRRRR